MEKEKPPLDEVLAHHGIKGMKWGHHKQTAPSSTPRISRKQNRQMNKQAANDFYAKKAQDLYTAGKKHGDKILMSTVLPGATNKTIITGKELVKHLEAGGALNIKATEIYARQSKSDGKYVLNNKQIGGYKKQNFRKQ